jgi:hypothetical protein
MGLGDQLLATGMARGAKAKGKRVAFGDGRRIIWDQHSEIVFRGNQNIAKPGSERDSDLRWIPYYKGHRLYNAYDRKGDRWIWNHAFEATPGEVVFTDRERMSGKRFGSGFVLIEPELPTWKTSSANKDWGRDKYAEVGRRLLADGFQVTQLIYPKMQFPVLPGVRGLRTYDFRDALAILASAALYIGPEGGLHHGAAAVGVRAVIMFGGFIPPSVTGYETHINLTGGAEACGRLQPCAHCRAAMAAITVEEVYGKAREIL